MGTSSGNRVLSPSVQDILVVLESAEGLFWEDFNLIARRGNAPRVRDTSMSLVLIKTLQNAIGKMAPEGPALVTRLLGKYTPNVGAHTLLKFSLNRFIQGDRTSPRVGGSHSQKIPSLRTVR